VSAMLEKTAKITTEIELIDEVNPGDPK